MVFASILLHICNGMRYVIKILFAALAAFAACDPPVEIDRSGDKLSGYITHIDSTLYLSDGFYTVSVYIADSVNPFNRVPFRTDSLNLQPMGNLWQTTYDMDGIPSGRYYIAATWSRYPRVPNEIPVVLGTYGCDTSYNCTDHKMVEYPNYQGNFRNITSWTDPAKRMN